MKWKRFHLLHLIPFFLAVAYLLPLYGSSFEDKAIYVKDLYESLSYDSFLLGGTRRLHQGAYIVATILLLVKEKKTLRFQREFESSLLLTSAFTSLWLVSIYRYFFSFDLLSGLIDTFLLSTIAIFLVYRQLSGKSSATRHLSKSDFEQMEKEMTKIKDLLSERKDFLNPQYSIKDLAHSLELPVPRVSKIINRTMGSNFNELINQYKVREAISLLQSERTKHLTIEAIANNAGFNSTSAFNDNFKRITGKSPKFYRM